MYYYYFVILYVNKHLGQLLLSGAASEFLPWGGKTNCARPSSPHRFLLSYTTLQIYAQFCC